MERRIIITAAIFGMTAIILGAFGAHALKQILSPVQLNSFETGVKYQMYHSLFLLFLGTTSSISDKAKARILNLVIFGVLFFSGSIYLMTTNSSILSNYKFIGLITPIGGLLLISAWALLLFEFLKKK